MSIVNKPINKEEAVALLLPQITGCDPQHVSVGSIKISREICKPSEASKYVLDLLDYMEIYEIRGYISQGYEAWYLTANDCLIVVDEDDPKTWKPYLRNFWESLPTCESVKHPLIEKIRGFLEKNEFSFKDSKYEPLLHTFIFCKGNIHIFFTDLNFNRR